jgi:chromosome segregation ATPase
MSEEKEVQSPNDLNLTNPDNIDEIIGDINNKRRQIATTKDKIKRIKTEIATGEESIIVAQTGIENINSLVISSWSQILQNINLVLSEMKQDLHDMKTELNSTKTDVKWLRNREQIRRDGMFKEIPFTVGKKPDNLATIKNIRDINLLTLEQVKTFLTGYGESTHWDEVTLKQKLAALHGVPYNFLYHIRTKDGL